MSKYQTRGLSRPQQAILRRMKDGRPREMSDFGNYRTLRCLRDLGLVEVDPTCGLAPVPGGAIGPLYRITDKGRLAVDQ